MPITGRAPKDCYEPFRRYVAQLVTRTLCGTAVFKVTHVESLRFRLRLDPPGSMIPLNTTGFGTLYLHIAQTLEAEKVNRRNFRLRTREYWYRLHDTKNLNAQALIRWEYDRDRMRARSQRPPRNHVHLPVQLKTESGNNLNLTRLHVPTGWVLIEEVIRFVISDLGVKPLCGSKWPDILADGEKSFRERFT